MNKLLAFIERFKLTTKLIVGLSSGIVVALIVGINGLNTMQKMETEVERMYDLDLHGISYIKDANLNLVYVGRALRQALIAQDETTRSAALATIKRSREKLIADLTEGRKRIFRAEGIAIYDEFQRDLTKALEVIEHAVTLIEKEGMMSSQAAKYITSPEFTAIIAKADGGLHQLTDQKEKGAEQTIQRLREEAASTRNQAVALLILGFVLSVLLGILIGASILRPNEHMRAAVESLAAGKVDEPIPHADFPNEVGVMARSLGVLQKIYRQANEQHWVKSNVSDISAALQGADDFRSLTQTVVSQVAPVIGAGHGAFYVTDADKRLTLLASYGYHRDRSAPWQTHRYLSGSRLTCARRRIVRAGLRQGQDSPVVL